jgi:hypothetical protein
VRRTDRRTALVASHLRRRQRRYRQQKRRLTPETSRQSSAFRTVTRPRRRLGWGKLSAGVGEPSPGSATRGDSRFVQPRTWCGLIRCNGSGGVRLTARARYGRGYQSVRTKTSTYRERVQSSVSISARDTEIRYDCHAIEPPQYGFEPISESSERFCVVRRRELNRLS